MSSALRAHGDQHGIERVVSLPVQSRPGAVLRAGLAGRLYHTPNRLSMYGGGLGVIMFGIVGWVVENLYRLLLDREKFLWLKKRGAKKGEKKDPDSILAGSGY